MKFSTFVLGALALFSVQSLQCSQGEVTDANRICVEPQYIQGCFSYATSTTCRQCQFRYRLDDKGLCQFTQTTNGPCCLSQDSQGNCNQCNKGLYLSQQGTCEQSNILGCLQKDKRGNCVNCATNFILTPERKCKQGIKHCVEYAKIQYYQKQAQECSRCKMGFSLINNSCLKNKILGCSKQEQHTCLKCYEPFTEKQNHCEIANCVTYNEYGCTHCDCGFFLTPKNICKELEKGCIRVERGVCTDCYSNFRLKGGSCIHEGCKTLDGLDCRQCEQGYDLKGGLCKMMNCQIWNDGSCELCDEGYHYSEGKCSQPSQFSAIKLDNIALV